MNPRIPLAILLLSAALAPTAPGQGEGEYPRLAFAPAQGDEAAPLRVVAGLPTPVRLVLHNPLGNGFQDEVRFVPGEGVTVTPPSAAVTVGARSAAEVSFRVTLDPSASRGEVTAFLVNHHLPGGTRVESTASVIPRLPVTFQVAAPELDGASAPLLLGWSDPVTLRIRATNLGPVPSPPVTLALDGAEADASLPTLAPGESLTLHLGAWPTARALLETAGRPVQGRASYAGSLTFTATYDDPGGESRTAPATSFRLQEGATRGERALSLPLEVHGGLVARARAPERIAPGEEGGIPVLIVNLGTTPVDHARVHALAHPLPDVPLAEGARVEGEQYVTLAPGERTTLTLPYAAPVAGPLLVRITTEPTGATPRTEETLLHVPGHVRLVSSVDLPVTAALGESQRLRLRLAATDDIPQGKVRFAVLPHPELVDVQAIGDRVRALKAGDEWTVDVTLSPKASGDFLVVPYVQTGDVIRLAVPDPVETGGLRTVVSGILPLRAEGALALPVEGRPANVPTAIVFAPALVVGLVAGFVVWTRSGVR